MNIAIAVNTASDADLQNVHFAVINVLILILMITQQLLDSKQAVKKEGVTNAQSRPTRFFISNVVAISHLCSQDIFRICYFSYPWCRVEWFSLIWNTEPVTIYGATLTRKRTRSSNYSGFVNFVKIKWQNAMEPSRQLEAK